MIHPLPHENLLDPHPCGIYADPVILIDSLPMLVHHHLVA